MADESTSDVVSVSHDSAVATVTLTRPALTAASKAALRDALIEVARDNAVRAVVLTGTGKAFCVGQDLAEHAEALRADASTAFATIDEHYNPIVMALSTMPKPVVAAINGTCVGAGLGFALACDLRVTADTAKFGTAFTGIGLTCDSGLSASLARAVGAARASELVLLGEPFTAAQAAEWGIAGRVMPAAEVASTAAELAARLASGPTRAYAEAKLALAASWGAPLPEVLRIEGEAQKRLGLTADHRGAVDSFLTKSEPAFDGS
ncbi:enoyl-CoA hydratase-related protein [Amycolatopsis endophytica]|uniref:2-(1,2-epoxy-1,2-dihydrophenyl)acetyl-CoA isomerase n=1 Tax=Amycolatopsis endophytica TaxID=860233 RepID=A0A853B5B4_9PSEU|nr:enoyl-CoA hydratase-related protein [Amycolatopsis endophytica]NYI90190.1 2-(1,2-epoxy-1,2-dihydrophenyl)acetyl-CoA isomerase [Amycolatopsis endophytica]